MPFQERDEILNKYRIKNRLYEGELASFWLAEEIASNNRVVLKTLRTDLGARQEAAQFFFDQEMQIRLQYQYASNIVYVKTVEPYEGRKLLVLPYIGEHNLVEYLQVSTDKLPVEWIISIALTLAKVLSKLHSDGIVHGDIQLSSILLDQNERPYLGGFDCAWMLSADQEEDRQQRAALGKRPKRLLPEQSDLAAPPTPAADIYALGCLLFQLLTGQEYKPGDNVASLRPDIPLWLAKVLDRMLASDPRARWRSLNGLAVALEQQQFGARWRIHAAWDSLYSALQHRAIALLDRIATSWTNVRGVLYQLTMLAFALLVPVWLIFVGIVHNTKPEAPCPHFLVWPDLKTVSLGEQLERFLTFCQSPWYSVILLFGLWLPILCAIVVAMGVTWFVSSDQQKSTLRRVARRILTLSAIVLYLASCIRVLTLSSATFDEIDVELANLTYFRLMGWGLVIFPLLLILINAWLRQLLGISTDKQMSLSPATIWAGVRQFPRYFRHTWIDLVDENNRMICGEPHDLQYAKNTGFIMSYRRDTVGGAQPESEIIHFDHDGKHQQKIQCLDPVPTSLKHILLSKQKGCVFALDEVYKHLYRLSWESSVGGTVSPNLIGQKISLFAFDERNDRLFLYSESQLYQWHDHHTGGKQEKAPLLGEQTRFDRMWYCSRLAGLVVVSQLPKGDSTGRYRGNKRIQVFDEDFSQDYCTNTDAGAAGFDAVRDITTTQGLHGKRMILVLHVGGGRKPRVSVYRAEDPNYGRHLCELWLPSPGFTPVSLATDDDDNIYILGKNDREQLTLLKMNRLCWLIRSRSWFELLSEPKLFTL